MTEAQLNALSKKVMVVSVAEVTPLVEAQFRSKLRLGGWSDGFLLNFNASMLKDGLRRLAVAPQRFLEREAAMGHKGSTDSANSFAPSHPLRCKPR